MKLLAVLLFLPIVFTFPWDDHNIARLLQNHNDIFTELATDECTKELYIFLTDLSKGAEWTMKDTWGTKPAGLYSETKVDIGHFDQCLSLTDRFQHQHCQLHVQNNRNQTYTLGICVPSSCPVTSLEKFMKQIFRNINLDILRVEHCQSGSEKPDFGFLQWTAIGCCVILVLLTALSTFHELVLGGTGIFNAFSIYQNANRLFDHRSGTQMSCLNGLRVLSMFWIILLHTYEGFFHLSHYTYDLVNPIDIKKHQLSFVKAWIKHGDLAVDTFFVIGGLLVAYNFIRALQQFYALKFYLHRFLRLTPVLSFVILMVLAVAPYVGAGPKEYSWMESHLVTSCKKNWMVSLLFVQNYFFPMQQCIAQAWYLSVDLHLYLLSPFALTALIKYGKRFIPILCLVSIASMTFMFMYSLHNSFHFNYMPALYKIHIYYGTQGRIAQWCIGIVLGYHLYETRNQQIQIRKDIEIVAWTASLTAMVGVIYIPYTQYRDQTENVLRFAFYVGLHRQIWALAVTWIIFVCVKGHGGPVNWMLSFPFYQPLVKLSYAIYLIHWPIRVHIVTLQRTLVYFSEYLFIHMYFGVFMFSLFLAVPVVLMVEMPVLNLEAEIYEILKKKKIKKN